MSKHKHAVLTDTHIVTIADGERKLIRFQLPHPITNLSELWPIAQELKLSHVWPMPDQFFTLQDSLARASGDDFDVFATFEDDEKQERPKFARFYKIGAPGHQVQVGYAHRGRFNWTVNRPLDILATLDYLERELGITVAWSPGHLGTKLLQAFYDRTETLRKRVRPPTINLKEIPYNYAARDLLFLRSLEESDIGKRIYGFDRSSAYLASCQDLYLGSGEPIHLDINERMTEPRRRQECGIYRVTVRSDQSKFDGVFLPLAIPQDKEWCTIEQLNCAYALGYEIFVHEGWIFEESHKLLQAWTAQLWGARARLKENRKTYCYETARLNAYKTVKEIALISVGKLIGEYETPFARPDWWAGIVGRARAVMLHNIRSIEEKHGLRPFLIYSDALYFVSDELDPRKAVPGILDREGLLGGYKCEYRATVTRELVEKSKELAPSGRVGSMLTFLKHEAPHE